MLSISAINFPVIKSKLTSLGENKYVFSTEPLLHGYGYTLGNSIRRIMLSSIPGFAVTKVKINNITHEYQGIDAVVEDAIDVILNLKSLRAKLLVDEDVVTIKLSKDKQGQIFAKDFDTGGKVEIINSDLYICSLSKDENLDIEVDITRGVGYLSNDKIDFVGNINPQDMLVDAVFSPVTNVALSVEQVRVGDQTDFDKLEIAFQTDGSVSGEEVIEFTLSLVKDLFSKLHSSSQNNSTQLESQQAEKEVPATISSSKKSSELDLTENVKAILEKNGILTLEELKTRESEVADFAGIENKHLKEIKKLLKNSK